MSDAEDALRALVPEYAGHADAAARRLSDQQVRAVVGELLAAAGERRPPGDLQERFDALLLRCEFSDQHAIRALDRDRYAQPEVAAQIEADDRALVEAASGAAPVIEDWAGFLDAVERAFDRRAETIARLEG
jgi:hypothetical protein